jgi:hypothetical protein
MGKVTDADMVSFGWRVPQTGFRWELRGQAEEAAELWGVPPFLVNCDAGGSSWEYHPLEDRPLLFDKFARLDGSPDAILKFANKYGRLGIDTAFHIEGSDQLMEGESLLLWQREIWRMRVCAQLWEWIRDGDAGKLGEHIIWPKDDTVWLEYWELDGERTTPRRARRQLQEGTAERLTGKRHQLIAATGQHPWTTGDVIGPAEAFLRSEVNRHLARRTDLRLLLTSSEPDAEFRPHIVPHDLLAAMWYQLHRALTGERRFRRCAVCSELMDVTCNTRAKTMHSECSARARQARHREKAKAAVVARSPAAAAEG